MNDGRLSIDTSNRHAGGRLLAGARESVPFTMTTIDRLKQRKRVRMRQTSLLVAVLMMAETSGCASSAAPSSVEPPDDIPPSVESVVFFDQAGSSGRRVFPTSSPPRGAFDGITKLQAGSSVSGPNVAQAATAASLEHLSRLPSTETVNLLVSFREDSIARDAADVEPHQKRVRRNQEHIKSKFGQRAEVLRTYWLVNAMIVRTTVAFARELSQWPEVLAIESHSGRLKPTVAAYSGNQLRGGTKLDSFVGWGWGFDGRAGHASGGPVRLGVIEHRLAEYPNWCSVTPTDRGPIVEATDFAADHYVFRNTDGSSRVKVKKECVWDGYSTVGCTNRPLASSSNYCGPSHSTEVAWVAAGNIQDGQDPANPPSGLLGPSITGARSGIATHADVYFYSVRGCWDLVDALQAAIADQVDVVNMSFQYDQSGYGPYVPYCTGVAGGCFTAQQALAAARVAGAGLVAASGNNQKDAGTACTQWFPAWDYNVLTVGNLNSSSDVFSYSGLEMRNSSSFGGVAATAVSGVTTRLSGVAIAAPGVFHLSAAQAPGYYNGPSGDGTNYIVGTSFSAPVVTGAFASLKNALYAYGLPSDNNTIFAHMLTLGDGYEPLGEAQRTVGPLGVVQVGLSRAAGGGRLMARHPGSLVAPGAWGTRAFTLNNAVSEYSWWVGGSATGQLPASVTQWRLGAFWYDVDYSGNPNTNIADVDFAVTNECNGCAYPGAPGCLYRARVADQTDYDTHNRIVLTGSNVAGKCLLVTAKLYSTSVSRTVYAVDWFDSSTDPLH